jgi:diguanylate cyclase (GGDEF)-like protein
LQGAKIAAEEQAFTDTLTGVKNRRAMDHILERYVEADLPFSVMHVDLDWFKQVNDTHGHAAGDHVLQVAARILVDETRADDTVIRAGGDEFLLIFPRLVRRDRLAAVAGRILSRLDAPIPYRGAACRVSASIGIASRAGGDALSAEAVVAAADAALYRSKKAGRARFSFAAEDAGGPSPHAAAGVVAPEAAPEDARPATG